MGQKFWGVDIQKEISQAMKSSDLPGFTLVKNAATTRATGHESGGTNSLLVTTLQLHGAIVSFDTNDLDAGQQIEKDDVCLVVIGKTLDDAGIEIEKSDFIIVDNRRRSVVWCRHDGARAAWRVQLR